MKITDCQSVAALSRFLLVIRYFLGLIVIVLTNPAF